MNSILMPPLAIKLIHPKQSCRLACCYAWKAFQRTHKRPCPCTVGEWHFGILSANVLDTVALLAPIRLLDYSPNKRVSPFSNSTLRLASRSVFVLLSFFIHHSDWPRSFHWLKPVIFLFFPKFQYVSFQQCTIQLRPALACTRWHLTLIPGACPSSRRFKWCLIGLIARIVLVRTILACSLARSIEHGQICILCGAFRV